METKDQTDKDQADKTGRTGNAAPSGAGGSGGRKPLSLQKTVESGHVRQNFSHGRSKSVVVETRKTRKLTAPGETETMAPPAPRPAPQTQQASPPAPQRAPQRDDRPQRSQEQRGDHGRQQPQLRQEERDARARALAEARRVAEVEDARRAELARNAPPPAPAPEAPAPAATAAVTTETPQAEAPAPAVSAVPSAPVATPSPEAAPSSNARAPEPRSGGSRPNESRQSEARSGERHNDRQSDRGGTPRHDGPRNDGPRPDFNRGERREGGGYQGRSGAPGGAGAGQGAPGGPRPYRAPQQPQGGYNTQFMTREGGRPKNIDIPVARPPAPVDRATTVEPPKAREPRSVEVRARPEMTEDEETRVIKRGGKIIRQPVKATPEPQRERGRLTIQNAFDQDQRERSLASLKRKRERERLKAMGIQQPRDKIVREVILPEAITIQELSNRMAERGVDVIKFLMKQGAMHKITDVIDADTAELIVQDFGHTVKRVSESDVESGFIGAKDQDDNLRARAPVVTIMGHVDHGKTSLLDAIRQTNVVSGEAGGITQHIGAYQVALPSGDKITFIDTPGHAAFTAMRARGAKVTDIVVLVVAADDGVMPQTVEAINHAKAAQVPMIVAINKIDKPQADPTRVRTDLLSHDVVVESMGGDTLEVPVSALKRTNLEKLLETINLQAEVLDLKANPDRTAEGIVIEAKLERGRGPVGTVLVQRGTLHVGDIVVAGTSWGRVRALINDKGENVVEAGPSVPVEVLGFDSAPEAGDQIAVVENDARAREITDYRIRKRRETLGAAGSKSTLEQMMQQLKEAGKKDFNLLIKGDVQGSVEAIMGSLKKLATDEVEARIVHSGVGGITESDIALAGASKAVVVGFNVRANTQAKQAAEAAGIEIRYYNIIYDLLDDVKAAMSGLLAPTIREVFLGNAEVLQVFNISKVGKVAGCRVTEGKVLRGGKVRLIRDNVVIHEGSLSVLKRFKDDVKEVPAGQECGMSFANYQDLRAGDVIECFNVETITRSL